MYRDLINQIAKYLKPDEKYYLTLEFEDASFNPTSLQSMVRHYFISIYLIYEVNNDIKIKVKIFSFYLNNEDSGFKIIEDENYGDEYYVIKLINEYSTSIEKVIGYMIIDIQKLIFRTIGGNPNPINIDDMLYGILKEYVLLGKYDELINLLPESGILHWKKMYNIMEYKFDEKSIKNIKKIAKIFVKRFNKVDINNLENFLTDLNDIEKQYITKNC